MTRGAPIQMMTGEVFGLLRVQEVVGPRAVCVCSCGKTTIVTKSNLKTGNTKSCGCLRVSNGQAVMAALNAVQLRRNWDAGIYSREKVAEMGKRNALNMRGRPAEGLAAKGGENCNAKWYAVVTPFGEVLSGINLSQLVRDNERLFDPSDVVWKKNKFGSDMWCRAMIGLRSLFRSKRPANSWKGWTPLERRSMQEGQRA